MRAETQVLVAVTVQISASMKQFVCALGGVTRISGEMLRDRCQPYLHRWYKDSVSSFVAQY
jgi:hypothetical protein